MNAPIHTKQYRADWADPPNTTRWLRDELFTGEVLVAPGGKFPFGDVTIDIDPSLSPDVIADLRNPPFSPQSFDTVYVDPPFSMWGEGGWLNDYADIARERLICQTTNEYIRGVTGKWKRSFYVSVGGLSVRLFQVFDRRDHSIDDFGGGHA